MYGRSFALFFVTADHRLAWNSLSGNDFDRKLKATVFGNCADFKVKSIWYGVNDWPALYPTVFVHFLKTSGKCRSLRLQYFLRGETRAIQRRALLRFENSQNAYSLIASDQLATSILKTGLTWNDTKQTYQISRWHIRTFIIIIALGVFR